MIKKELRTIIIITSSILISIIIGKYLKDLDYQTKIESSKSEPVFNNIVKITTKNKITIDKELFSDKVVVINLWASWCRPCLKEINELNTIVGKFEHKDVTFLAISEDLADKATFNSLNLNKKYNNIYDKVLFGYLLQIKPEKDNTIPFTIVLNKQNEVEYFLSGYKESNISIIEDYINSID
jgi:thiol-disulfide isomerase/thioredoxin